MQNVPDVIQFLQKRLNAELVVEENLPKFLGDFKPDKILSLGKAASNMALGAKKLFPAVSGLIVTKFGHAIPVNDFQILEASHPIPDQSSVHAAQTVIKFLESVEGQLLVLISGGASALLCSPLDGISLSDIQDLTDQLLNSGADIFEINLVRKCFSKIKGGGLTATMRPECQKQTRIALISDVIGNDISTISGGPFCGPPAEINVALTILDSYQICLSKSIYQSLNETQTRLDVKNPPHYILSDVSHALSLATEAFQNKDYDVHSMVKPTNGLIKDNIEELIDWIRYKPESVWITGGECTVKHFGKGKGGRNQQWVVEAGLSLLKQGFYNFEVFSYASDGNDGPTDSAGGWLTSDCLSNHIQEAQVAVENYDTYPFLNKIGAHLRTGPTGTNVNDIRGVLFRR